MSKNTLRQYGYHVCYKQEPLSYFKGLEMRTFGFWQEERESFHDNDTMVII